MTCPVDGKPLTNNAVICVDCEVQLDQALGDLDWLLEDLDTALTRQTKQRPARGSHERDDKPLPYAIGASKAAGDLKAILVAWAKLVSDERGTELTCQDTSQSISSWLMHHVHWLACHDAAPDAHTEIVGAVNNIRRTIDIAPDTRYIGPCGTVDPDSKWECTEVLYAIDGAPTLQCRTCGTVWDVGRKTLDALMQAESIAQDATTLSRSFRLNGIAIETQRIKRWHQRQLLAAAGESHRGHRTYIVAHVARLINLYETGQKLTPWPEPTEQEVPA